MAYRRRRRSFGGRRYRRRPRGQFTANGAQRYELATFSTNSNPSFSTQGDGLEVSILGTGNAWTELVVGSVTTTALGNVSKGFELAGIIYDVGVDFDPQFDEAGERIVFKVSHVLYVDRIDNVGIPDGVLWSPYGQSDFPVGFADIEPEQDRPLRILHRREVVLSATLNGIGAVTLFNAATASSTYDSAFTHNRVRLGRRLLDDDQALCLGLYVTAIGGNFNLPQQLDCAISGSLYYKWRV